MIILNISIIDACISKYFGQNIQLKNIDLNNYIR